MVLRFLSFDDLMSDSLSVSAVLAELRESPDPKNHAIADLIDTLIDQRQDAINKRERDLAAWRHQTELVRELVGRKDEDVGIRRMIVDLLNKPEMRVKATNARLLDVARFYAEKYNWMSMDSESFQTSRYLWGNAIGVRGQDGWAFARETLEEMYGPDFFDGGDSK